MSNSLRDQLLGLGFQPPPKPERKETRPAPRKDEPRREDSRKGAEQRRGRPQDARGPQRSGDAAKPNPNASQRPRGPAQGKGGQKPRTREDIDLAKAYAIRSQREKEERIAAEAAKQEEARKRREARAKVTELVKDKSLNAADAEIARHFPYGGKIKRIYVTAEQLKALNSGDLGVLQLDGRYLLVDKALVMQAQEIFPPAVALLVDPNAPAEDDPYADPMYQVPDDLVW